MILNAVDLAARSFLLKLDGAQNIDLVVTNHTIVIPGPQVATTDTQNLIDTLNSQAMRTAYTNAINAIVNISSAIP